MKKQAVAVYDLSGSSGWAVWAPGMDRPAHGIVKLPPPKTDGSSGPAFEHLFNHVAWLDRRFGLAALGYEQFLAATGGKKDQETSFVTSPKTIKRLVGNIAVIELCASMMRIDSHHIHNMSWRTFWLGSQKRGTKREDWKRLAVKKARDLDWDPKGDDDADALGQLHFLLHRMGIRPAYSVDPPTGLLVGVAGAPLNV